MQFLPQERSLKRRKHDPIVVEKIASNDEWITKIEDPALPEDHMCHHRFMKVAHTFKSLESLHREPTPPREPTQP
ncbi:hypothetical protein DVH24_006106 [Malus domestica]|uniref:Uncharacterized protein n=1 Tax=Malus domestica TaxID=3750 RepID=A0A498J0N8_MALDO|nr:hypothetical protein DVH24_006106 [Malus domestica]